MPLDNTPTMGKFSWKEKTRRRKTDIADREESPHALPGPQIERIDGRTEREEGEVEELDFEEGDESPTLRRSRRNHRSEDGEELNSDETSPLEEMADPKRIKIHTTTMHQCERCGKVYKHKNCLVKHGWEHHESWQMTKKWCQTKHQQVQMLEAAHVLVEMTGRRGTRVASLPGKLRRI
jgi:DnaJ-class molecular chaperone